MKLLLAVFETILGPLLCLNTVEGGDDIMADLALGRIVPATGRPYASQVRRRLMWPDPSESARDDPLMVKLW